MKVIKKINNNVAVCMDNNNHELIAFGKGIGFLSMPYDLEDLSKIDRTYYGVNENYLNLLNEIPEDIFELSAKIVDYAKGILENELNPNITFTLADHINFALDRYKKGMVVKTPFIYDIQYLYEKEMSIAKKAVKYINRKKKITLAKDEATGIALHFINAENIDVRKGGRIDESLVIDDITEIIEKKFDFTIDKNGFNYSRFVSHIQYLFKRQQNNISVASDNEKIFAMLKEECPGIYECVLDIGAYIEKELGWKLNDEELLYLILHVNRLCSREDCNQ